MQEDLSLDEMQRRYAGALRRVAQAKHTDPLDLARRRENAAQMAQILIELHGDKALAWAIRMESLPSRTAFTRMVRLELERVLALKVAS